ncbi:MAG: selenium metabolism-associated LysR family transcriptional regulator [Nitrospirota bacterium]
MDDHKLRVFCTVAETKSFSRTSELIHLTQPAVSLQVQALEELYETKLFDRSGGSVNLTPAGEILYKYAKDILGLYAFARRDISAMIGLVKGNLSIGASTTVGNYLLPSVIVKFRRNHPRIWTNLIVGNTRLVTEKLLAGEIDLGIVEGDVTKHNLVAEKLLPDELVVIMNPEHEWARRKNISVSELIKEPLIMREKGSGTRQMIEKRLEENQISPDGLTVSLYLGSTEAIKTAVQEGLGISIISAWAARKEIKAGTLVANTFKDARFTRHFSIIQRKKGFTSHTLGEFLEFVKIYPFEDPLGI